MRFRDIDELLEFYANLRFGDALSSTFGEQVERLSLMAVKTKREREAKKKVPSWHHKYEPTQTVRGSESMHSGPGNIDEIIGAMHEIEAGIKRLSRKEAEAVLKYAELGCDKWLAVKALSDSPAENKKELAVLNGALKTLSRDVFKTRYLEAV